jgi:hypothetical protein
VQRGRGYVLVQVLQPACGFALAMELSEIARIMCVPVRLVSSCSDLDYKGAVVPISCVLVSYHCVCGAGCLRITHRRSCQGKFVSY